MELITNPIIEWKEPSIFYKWQRKKSLQQTPLLRFIIGYSIMVFGPALTILILGLLFDFSITRLVIVALTVIGISLSSIILSNLERANIWILKNKISYRRGSKYKSWNYDQILSFEIREILYLNDAFSVLNLNLKSGEMISLALDKWISSKELINLLKGKIGPNKTN